MDGDIVYGNVLDVRSLYSDGADIGAVTISGGGAALDNLRGSSIAVYGNETGRVGSIDLQLGQDVAAQYLFKGWLGSTLLTIDRLGTINYPSPTASLPLALDASNNIVSKAIDLDTTDTSGILPVEKGGTGLDGSAMPDGALLIGDGTGYTSATLTATVDQTTITNAAGSITVGTVQDIATTSSPTFTTVLATDLTAGSIVFAGPSQELSDDNANLFWDDTADSLSIGHNASDASAILNVSSTSSGVLIPRMTTAEKVAIATPATSLMVFDTDQNKYNFYNGTTWKKISGSELESETLAASDYDLIQVPFSQLTATSSTPDNVVRIETGNDSFMSNPSFEHETYDTGWTSSGTATYALETTDVWEGSQAVSASTSGGTQILEICQTATKTQYFGNTVGVTCMVKSDSAKIQLCTNDGTNDKDCVSHDGNGGWKKMQAIMSVDTAGIMKACVRNTELANASVVIDSCEWSNDPLKIKTKVDEQEYVISQSQSTVTDRQTEVAFNLATATISDSGPKYITAEADGIVRTKFVANMDVTVDFSADAIVDTGSHGLCIAKNGTIVRRGSNGDGVTTTVGVGVSGTFHLTSGDYLTYGSCSNVEATGFANGLFNNVAYTTRAQIVAKYISQEILTASDIVSSVTMAFVFEPTTTFDCSTQPVGTYTTYGKNNNSNSRINCATAPTLPPTNLDGFFIDPAAFTQSGNCTNQVPIFEICIGKGLKGYEISAYLGAAKSGVTLSTSDYQYTGGTGRGVDTFYNEVDGTFTIDSGTSHNGAETSRFFQGKDAADYNGGYFHFHASKNPVVNAMETIPIVDYSWENEFSAKILNPSGTATIQSQNKTFIQSVNRDSAGVVTVTFVTGFFTIEPAVVAIVNRGTPHSQYAGAYNGSANSIQIQSMNDAGIPADFDFDIYVSRQGSDYKERGSTAAIIAQPTCYVKDFKGGCCRIIYCRSTD